MLVTLITVDNLIYLLYEVLLRLILIWRADCFGL